MKIIITGATGSLGAYLTRWFSSKGHEVIATGRKKIPPPALYRYAEYIPADITSAISLPEAEVCIHTAALATDKAADEDLWTTNVTGTQNVMDAAKHCNMFIHVSTSSVYSHSSDPLTEEEAGERRGEKLSAYGRSKLFAEDVLAKNHRNDSCFILRPRGIYGAGDKVLLPRLLKLVRNNKMIRAGSMNVKLSMTHFSNFAMAVEKCMYSGKKGLHIYNVADDEIYVLYDIIKKLLSELHPHQLTEKKIPLWIFKFMSVLRIGEATPLFLNTVSKNMVLDISRIKREINYDPTTNFYLHIKEIADWVKSIGGSEIVKKADPALAWSC